MPKTFLAHPAQARSGARRAQCLPAGVDDLVGDEHRAHGGGRALGRVDDAALGRDQLDGPEGALVARDVGLEERGERGVDAGAGVRPGAVLEAADLRARPAEIHGGAVALDGEARPHRQVARLEAVVVGVVGALVDPVREGGQRGPHPPLGVVEDAVEERERPLHGDLLGELRHALRPDAGRADHRAQVAVLKLRGARVREQQTPQVAAGLAARDELEGGQSHPLLPGVVGERVVGAGRPAADVGLVGAVAAERDAPAVDEHRARDDPVGQVVAAGLPGVVQHEDVAGLDVVFEVAQHRAHREAAPAGVDRDPVRLRDQPAVRPAHEAGEVVGLAEDGAARGAHHHLAHLPGDVVQAVLGEGELDGVEGRHVGGRRSSRGGDAVCRGASVHGGTRGEDRSSLNIRTGFLGDSSLNSSGRITLPHQFFPGERTQECAQGAHSGSSTAIEDRALGRVVRKRSRRAPASARRAACGEIPRGRLRILPVPELPGQRLGARRRGVYPIVRSTHRREPEDLTGRIRGRNMRPPSPEREHS